MMTPGLLALSLALAPMQADDLEPTTSFVVGEPAPHIHLPEITSGAAIDLERYRGKKVLLAEFASW